MRATVSRARDPESAMSGLFLYFSCLKEAHDLLHTFGSLDGAYWHGIMHRMEGDAITRINWFRRTKLHPMYPVLQREARNWATVHRASGIRSRLTHSARYRREPLPARRTTSSQSGCS